MSLAILRAALPRQRHHLSAFLMLGDPDPDRSVALALAAVDAGASMLELGIPFGDPCADGPAIQRSCQRALARGTTTSGALAILATIHAAAPTVPLNLLVYGNLVHARGYDTFCADAVAAGAASLLVPDIPIEESGPLRRATAATGLGHVCLVGPQTDAARLARLDAEADGFLYLAGYQGVTGAQGQRVEHVWPSGLAAARNPVCLGFGVSGVEHVRDACRHGASMIVVGSHLARAIESDLDGDPEAALRAAVRPLAAAARIESNQDSQDSRQGENVRCS